MLLSLEFILRAARRAGILLLTLSVLAPSAIAADKSLRRQIRFGADMAQAGNWREAIFRWNRALESDPRNARLLNNLAVAYETTGDYEKARATYEQAMRFGSGVDAIRSNYAMFNRFYKQYHSEEGALARGETPASIPDDADDQESLEDEPESAAEENGKQDGGASVDGENQ